MQKTSSFFSKEAVVHAITIAVALLIVYVTIDSAMVDREAQKAAAQRNISSLVDLAADDISRALGGARESMRLLSRMPALRETRSTGLITENLMSFFKASPVFFAVLESEALFIARLAGKGLEFIEYWLEVAGAGGRRIAGFFGIPFEADPSAGIFAETIPATRVQASLADLIRTCFQLFQEALGQMIVLAESTAVFGDQIIGFSGKMPANLDDVQRLLISSLSDQDLIRSVEVRTITGQKISEVTEIREPMGLLMNWAKAAGKSSRSFYSGPVWYDEGLGRPIWNAAVLLRDRDRQPYALLTSQIDLLFLSELNAKSRISSASYLFLVDEDGVVISHPKASIVANQVNVAHTNQAVAEAIEGNDGVREIQVGGTSFFTAYRHLQNLDRLQLPGWSVLYMLPTSEVLTGTFDMLFHTIFWFVFSFYVLFYVNDLILTSLEEELEA